MAEMTRRLVAAGARTIAFDLLFAEPELGRAAAGLAGYATQRATGSGAQRRLSEPGEVEPPAFSRAWPAIASSPTRSRAPATRAALFL